MEKYITELFEAMVLKLAGIYTYSVMLEGSVSDIRATVVGISFLLMLLFLVLVVGGCMLYFLVKKSTTACVEAIENLQEAYLKENDPSTKLKQQRDLLQTRFDVVADIVREEEARPNPSKEVLSYLDMEQYQSLMEMRVIDRYLNLSENLETDSEEETDDVDVSAGDAGDATNAPAEATV